MKKTTKIMLGISTTAISLGLAGCGKELPPKPKDQACRDWDWNDELGVWECDETTSRHYGGYYYGGRYYNSSSNLRNASTYKTYEKSASFLGTSAAKKSSGFGSGNKTFGG